MNCVDAPRGRPPTPTWSAPFGALAPAAAGTYFFEVPGGAFATEVTRLPWATIWPPWVTRTTSAARFSTRLAACR
jgi:hypothetical protein